MIWVTSSPLTFSHSAVVYSDLRHDPRRHITIIYLSSSLLRHPLHLSHHAQQYSNPSCSSHGFISRISGFIIHLFVQLSLEVASPSPYQCTIIPWLLLHAPMTLLHRSSPRASIHNTTAQPHSPHQVIQITSPFSFCQIFTPSIQNHISLQSSCSTSVSTDVRKINCMMGSLWENMRGRRHWNPQFQNFEFSVWSTCAAWILCV